MSRVVTVNPFEKEFHELYSLWCIVAQERPFAISQTEDEFINNYFKNEIKDHPVCLVAHINRELVGAGLVELFRGWDGCLLNLWVLPKHQRKGIGTKILEVVMNELKQFKHIKTISMNPVPFLPGYISFFKKARFMTDEKMPSGLVMERKIKNIQTVRIADGYSIAHLQNDKNKEWLRQMATLEIGEATGQYKIEEIMDDYVNRLKPSSLFSLTLHRDEVVGFSFHTIAQLMNGGMQMRNQGLVVNPLHRNKGLGLSLLVDGLKWGELKKIEIAMISTHSKNPARFLYEKAGYRTVDEIPNLQVSII